MEEIEALEAIYGDDITVDITSDHSVTFSKTCIPRTDVYYVETDLKIHCEENLVLDVTLISQKGMSDMGVDFVKQCGTWIADRSCDMSVFDLIEYIIDYLDSINIPECLICAESCGGIDSNSSTNGFIKTVCSHIFHTKCILYWAGICYEQQFESKEFSDMLASQDVAGRSAEGDMRSAEAEVEQCRLQMARNIELVAALGEKLTILETAPPPVSAGPHVTVIRSESIATAAKSVGEPDKVEPKGKTRRGKGKGGHGQATAIPSDMATGDVSSQSAIPIRSPGGEDEETVASVTRRLKELDIDSAACNLRLEKLLEKLSRCAQQTRRAKQDRAQAVKKWTKKKLFSCPICRHQLNLNDYALSLPTSSSSSSSSSSGGATGSLAGVATGCVFGFGGGLGSAVDSGTTGHLSLLSAELLAYVRKVQSYQQKLKGRLKCKPKANT